MVAPKLNNTSYRAFFESAAQGMLLVSEKGILLDANREACDALGYRREELSGMVLRDLLDPACRDAIPPNGGLPAERRELELRFLRPDGGSASVEVLLAPCSGGNGADHWGILFHRRSGGFEEACGEGTQPGEALVSSDADLIEEMRRQNEGLEGRGAQQVEQLRAAMSEADDYEQMLHESLDMFRATFDRAAAGIAHVDPDGRWLSVNKKFCEIVGHSRESLLKKTFHDITHPDDLGTHVENTRRLLAGDVGTCTADGRYLRGDGSVVWVHLTVSLVCGPSGAPRYFIFVIEDITERKRAEETLRQSEERFRSLVRYASDIIVIIDADGTVLYESPAVERVLGSTPGEKVGTNAFDDVHPDDAEAVRNKFAEILRRPDERMSAECRIRDREGSWRSFEAIGANLLDDPSIKGIVVNARDITDRKRAQERLEEAEERYRTLVEAIPAVTYIRQVGNVETVRYLSPQVEAMTGYLPEDFYTDPPPSGTRSSTPTTGNGASPRAIPPVKPSGWSTA